MRREYDETVLWGTRYKIEKISGLISQQGEAGNRTVNYCGGIISRCGGVKTDSAGTARQPARVLVFYPYLYSVLPDGCVLIGAAVSIGRGSSTEFVPTCK